MTLNEILMRGFEPDELINIRKLVINYYLLQLPTNRSSTVCLRSSPSCRFTKTQFIDYYGPSIRVNISGWPFLSWKFLTLLMKKLSWIFKTKKSKLYIYRKTGKKHLFVYFSWSYVTAFFLHKQPPYNNLRLSHRLDYHNY